MQLSAFAWLPFAMIGVGFIFILVSAIGLYLVIGRVSSAAADNVQYGVPYVPQDAAARLGMPPNPPGQANFPIDPVSGQPVYSQPGYGIGAGNAATNPSPTNPSPRGAASGPIAQPLYCLQCGFMFQHESQNFCPRCGARRTS